MTPSQLQQLKSLYPKRPYPQQFAGDGEGAIIRSGGLLRLILAGQPKPQPVAANSL